MERTRHAVQRCGVVAGSPAGCGGRLAKLIARPSQSSRDLSGFASKLAAERVVADSGLPWTTLRATQFHDLILTVARQMARLPLIPVPAGSRVQPVDAGEVADRLAELALGTPAGLVPDMAGPRVYGAAEPIRGTCGPVASTARSCRSGCRARPPGRSGPAPTCHQTEPWAGGPGRSFWPNE
jgi:uncharacterized protein YbjT (DUF2867 family)